MRSLPVRSLPTWITLVLLFPLLSACSGEDDSDSPLPQSPTLTPAEPSSTPPGENTSTPDVPSPSPETPSPETPVSDTPTVVPETPTPTPSPMITPTPFEAPEAGLVEGLEDPWFYTYRTPGDGGLAHVTYWSIIPGSEAFFALPPPERIKLLKIQEVELASRLMPTPGETSGVEATGTLRVEEAGSARLQEVLLKLPDDWNGKLVVLATSGQFTEFSNEAIFSWWLLEQGYAVAAGNKGMTNGGASGLNTLLNGQHPTALWGPMMLDLTRWAQGRLEAVAGKAPTLTYVAGHSNGGYLVRKALELEHLRVQAGEKRLLDGGLDWSGLYWPDARVLDVDGGGVSAAEFQSGGTLFTMMDGAALAMGYRYAEGTQTTTAGFYQTPPFQAVQGELVRIGFTSASAPFWGIYNTLFEAATLYGLENLKGVGYYNISGYLYRAELLGHTYEESAAYSCYAPEDGSIPPYYEWLGEHPEGGWTAEAIEWAMVNANSAVFSVPLISVQGESDGFIGVLQHGKAYEQAVKEVGTEGLYRLYVVTHGAHLDVDSDGGLDFDLDGVAGNEGTEMQLAPLQGFVRRGFETLESWVEEGVMAPPSATLEADPLADVLDPTQLKLTP
ncbi:MAG: hypothetical protein ACKO6N_22735 [Myxococcota bacterium]